MATIPVWAIIAFFVVDTIVMAGVVFFVLSKRNASSGGSSSTPNTFGNPSNSPFESAFSSSTSNQAGDNEILALLQRGQKIEAIKIYRERTNCGLKDAKDAVEALERQM